MKYLDYYKKAMKTGRLLGENSDHGPNGLCNEPGFRDDLTVFRPTEEEVFNYCLSGYWASDVNINDYFDLRNGMERSKTEFGPTRQTIVLFLAAMNNEL